MLTKELISKSKTRNYTRRLSAVNQRFSLYIFPCLPFELQFREDEKSVGGYPAEAGPWRGQEGALPPPQPPLHLRFVPRSRGGAVGMGLGYS